MATFYFTFGALTVLVALEVVAGYYIFKTLRSLTKNARSLERQIEEVDRNHTEIFNTFERSVDMLRDELYRNLEEYRNSKGVVKG